MKTVRKYRENNVVFESEEWSDAEMERKQSNESTAYFFWFCGVLCVVFGVYMMIRVGYCGC